MEPEDSLPHSQVPATCPYPEPKQIQSMPQPTAWRSIIPIYIWVFQVVSFSHASPARPIQLYNCLLPHACYMPRSFRSSRFHHPNNIWWGIQFSRLLIVQFPSLPWYFNLLGPNTLLSSLFSVTFSLRSSLNVSDPVSHPYKTTGKILFLYIIS